jgi:uncharacterized protein
MDESLERKLQKLREGIRKLDSALIAYSGGVDSTFLLRICREELGEKAVAVTTFSKSTLREELSVARRIAKVMGVRHMTVEGDIDPDEVISRAPALHQTFKSIAARMRLKHVVDGSHKDDASSRSRSLRAARMAGVKSPLLDSGLTKSEIRLLALSMGLPNWDKDSSSSSRKRNPIRKADFTKIEKCKKLLEKAGAKNATMLVDGKTAYILTDKKDMVKIARHLDSISRKLKSMGYKDVVLRLSS